MLAHRVRPHALARLTEQGVLLERAARARHARLGIDDEIARVNQPCLDQRQQQHEDRSRVASRASHKTGLGDVVTIMLGETVDSLLLQVEGNVVVAVPLLVCVRIAQPEVRRHVDDLDVVRQGDDDLLAGGVRQAAERGINAAPVDLVIGDHGRQTQTGKVRVYGLYRLAGVGVGGQRHDFHVRVGHGQSHQIRPGVPGCADDSDANLLCAHVNRPFCLEHARDQYPV
jgi:hypothetical protein